MKALNSLFEIKNVLVVENLGLPFQSVTKEIVNYCFNETGILVNSYDVEPQMLIGQNYISVIMTREYHQISNSGLVLSRCSLGWTIHANVYGKPNSFVCLVEKKLECYSSENFSKLNKLIKSYFDLDSLGVSKHVAFKSEDKLAIEILDKTSKYVNGAWEVGLLWKQNNLKLPKSRATALNRLYFLEWKLDKDKKFAELYYNEMDRLIENKFAIKALHSPSDNGIRQWYLPHFGVQNVIKPGKVRLVFDAAAKTENFSFNDFLLSGPDLLKPL